MCTMTTEMSIIVIIMGTAATTVVAEIDICCGGGCRGMLVRGAQGEASGMHGIPPGGKGGDHSGSMAGGLRWGAAAHASGGGTARREGDGSRGADVGEGCLPPAVD